MKPLPCNSTPGTILPRSQLFVNGYLSSRLASSSESSFCFFFPPPKESLARVITTLSHFTSSLFRLAARAAHILVQYMKTKKLSKTARNSCHPLLCSVEAEDEG